MWRMWCLWQRCSSGPQDILQRHSRQQQQGHEYLHLSRLGDCVLGLSIQPARLADQVGIEGQLTAPL